jgi:hypothetical protein
MILLVLLAAAAGLPAMSVTLTPSIPSPAPLGTVVTWSVEVADAEPGNLWYSFRVREADRAYRIIRDFGPESSLDWTTIRQEGDYEMEVVVKDRQTGAQSSAASPFTFTSLVPGDSPVATPTLHPLVLIYSAPPCPAGGRMRVEFSSPEGFAQHTPWKDCSGTASMNFYLAGMRPNTTYIARHTVESDSAVDTGPDVPVSTVDISATPPSATLLTTSHPPTSEGILLQGNFGGRSFATDLTGNVVWYSPSDITIFTRPETGGTFMGLGEDFTRGPAAQLFREFDLVGITVAETNAARVNEQLAKMGVHPITSFHHEARKLRDGSYLVLAASERILNDVQGPGPVDIIGDTILVLNPNLQVVWAWDSFDHLDVTRAAVLGETCNRNSGLACPTFYLAPAANDWLHGNALQLTPDGNILYSVRHQDWLVKIDYQDGLGTGKILWRLGLGGDFQISSSDASPWFSHQHASSFEADNATLTLFDNGNGRSLLDRTARSRGQVLVIDESNLVAHLALNADLGSYSPAVGSAQRLSNGNYHFDSGFILDPSGSGNGVAQSVEVDLAGNIVYGIEFGQLMYRSFRMKDLYTAPAN